MAIDDSYSKVLLHMNGSDGSTTFTDESGKIWTVGGNAEIDTAQSKFGGASGLFPGITSYLQINDNPDFTLGSGDFTFDCWIKRSSIGSNRFLFGQCDSSGSNVSIYTYFNSSNQLYTLIQPGNKVCTSSGTITDTTTWHHLAWIRHGNTFKQYIDGSAYGTIDLTGVTVNDSAYKFSIGRAGEHPTAGDWAGWIDEFRFSKGIARWTGNFTPPNVEYGMGGQVIIWTSE